MATERIQIIVTSQGAVTVKKELGDIGTTAGSSANSVGFLTGALAALVSGQAVSTLLSLADAGTQLTNSLRVAGLSGQPLVEQQTKLFDIAKANGQNVNELAGIYQKLTSVQGQLGASNTDLDKTLQIVAASQKLSSSSAESQAGALQQLSQLFGGVNVQAQEYNSLIDGAYPLLQAVASGSDRFGGSVSALTQAVRASSVTTKEFFDALLKGGDVNVKLAASFNLTIGQALTNFRTAMIQNVLVLNQSTGAFAILANGINFAANNMGIMAAALSPLIAALVILAVETIGSLVIGAFTSFLAVLTSTATFILGSMIPTIASFAVEIVSTVIPALISLTTAMLTNPLFAAGAAAVIVGIVAFRDQLVQLGATIRDTVTQITGLDKLGNFANGAFNINVLGDDFARKASSAIVTGGGTAANSMKNGITSGGKEAADALKAGTAEYSKAVYEFLNGVPQKLTGAIKTGADYEYNQITGAVTLSSQTGGNYMHDSIVSAGASAASAMGAAISSAANEATIALNQSIASAQSALSSNSVNLGLGFIPGGTDANATLHQQQGGKRGGNLSQAIQDSMGTPNTDSSGQARDSHYISDFQALVQGNGPVTVQNYVAPTDTFTAIDTKQGNKTIVNVIKGNAAEIKAILGIV